MRILNNSQKEFILYAKKNNIKWADAIKKNPEKNNSVDVLYCSHMFEHLDREDADKFLNEVHRILKSGGIIRIASPNLKRFVDDYIKDGDRDNFIIRTSLTKKSPNLFLRSLNIL